MDVNRGLLLLWLGVAIAASCALPAYSVGGPEGSTASSGGGDPGATTSSTGTAYAGGGGGGCQPPCSATCGNGVGERGELCLKPAGSISVGARPVALAAADLDGDGATDLVVLSQDAAEVRVLRGDGDGDFEPSQPISSGPAPTSLALAYMDAGPSIDVVVGHQLGVSVFRNDATAGGTTFSEPSVVMLPSVVAIAATDLSGNGPRDIVAGTTSNAGTTSSTLNTLVNDGNAALTPTASQVLQGSPTAVATDDIDGNGIYDLAVATSDPATLILLLRGSDGNVVAAPIDLDQGTPLGLALADLDADGRLDILTANHDSATLNRFYNQGNGAFAASTTIAAPAGPRALTVADLNHDDVPDVAVAAAIAGQVAILLGAQADLAVGPVFDAFVEPSALVASDLNRDGFPDLVIAEAGADRVAILLSDP